MCVVLMDRLLCHHLAKTQDWFNAVIGARNPDPLFAEATEVRQNKELGVEVGVGRSGVGCFVVSCRVRRCRESIGGETGF